MNGISIHYCMYSYSLLLAFVFIIVCALTVTLERNIYKATTVQTVQIKHWNGSICSTPSGK
jgi:hypothetical protein